MNAPDCPTCGEPMHWKNLEKPRCASCEGGASAEPFRREHDRYIVVKVKDLPGMHAIKLHEYLKRKGLDDHLVECVVVESDWPIYEAVWEMVRRLDQDEPLPYMADRDTLVRAYRAWIEEHRESPDDFYQPKEFFSLPVEEAAESLADQFIEYLTKGDPA